MKFGAYLENVAKPAAPQEWREQFVRYKHLKKALKQQISRSTSRATSRAGSFVRSEDGFGDGWVEGEGGGVQGVDIGHIKAARKSSVAGDSSESDGGSHEGTRSNLFSEDTVDMIPMDQMLREDVQMINQLHEEVLKECELVYRQVKKKLASKVSEGITLNPNLSRQLSHALQVLKRRLDLLNEYISVNVLAFQKILKKRTKQTKKSSLTATSEIDMAYVLAQPFIKSVMTNQLLARVESLESKLFKDWEFRRTMKEVRREIDTTPKTAMSLLGIYFAVSTELFITMIITMAVLGSQEDDSSIKFLVNTSYPIWSMLVMFAFYGALWAMNMFVWSGANINYMFILELDPYNHYSYMTIFHDAALCMVIIFSSFTLYLMDIVGIFTVQQILHIPWHHGLFHLLIFVTFLLITLCPFNYFRLRTRKSLGKTLIEVLGCAFIVPRFRHTFVADILTSMPKLLANFSYALCHYLSGDWYDTVGNPLTSCSGFDNVASNVIHFIPYGIRLIQCIRMYFHTKDRWHLANAGKYASCVGSTAVSVYYGTTDGDNTWFVLMMITATWSALYAYWWDVHKDWGLGQWDVVENPGLRRELMFRERKWVYYWAILSDLALRFGWMVTTLLPGTSAHKVVSAEVTLVFSALELFRRAQWSVFRLENEQLHKVDDATIEAVFTSLQLDNVNPTAGAPPSESTSSRSEAFSPSLRPPWTHSRGLRNRGTTAISAGSSSMGDHYRGRVDSIDEEQSVDSGGLFTGASWLLSGSSAGIADRNSDVALASSHGSASVGATSAPTSVDNNLLLGGLPWGAVHAAQPLLHDDHAPLASSHVSSQDERLSSLLHATTSTNPLSGPAVGLLGQQSLFEDSSNVDIEKSPLSADVPSPSTADGGGGDDVDLFQQSELPDFYLRKHPSMSRDSDNDSL